MSKKLYLALIALIMSICCIFTACEKGGNSGDSNSASEQSAESRTDSEEQIKYEGEMLYNGFDTVKDLYAIDQIYEWGYTPYGKLDIVGKDKFIPDPDDLESQETLDKIIAQINALPAAEDVELSDIDAIRKARKAYGALTDEGKKLITNISVLKEVEAAAAIQNYYTLADFGGSYATDITGAGDWVPYTGNLVNKKEGHIIFKVKGINANVDGAFYISLFHDPSKNAGQAGDGIVTWVRTNVKHLLFQNIGDKIVSFNEGKNVIAGENCVFDYYYKVEDDYSKVTITIKMSTESGEVIAEGTQEVTSATFSDFGSKTIEEWLSTDETASGRYTFFLDTGNSSGVDITSAWTGVSSMDFEEPSTDDPHTAEDLAPRQGEGALRVYYKGGSFKEILARFERSSLSTLPKKEIGALSVKVYNDSAKKKSITLALVGEQNATIAIDGGTFELAPYAWTTCEATLDPVIVDYFAEKLTGISLNFSDKFESVYYVDDFKVTFGKTYTDEIKELIAKVDALKADIDKLEGKEITVNDKDLLEGLYTRYNELPQAYRFTVDNADLLTSSISAYFSALKFEEETETGDVTAMRLNELLGLTQISDFTGGTYSFDTTEHLAGELGSLKIEFDGSMDWVTIPLKPSKSSDYDELHVWVKNVSEKNRAFQVNWHVSAAQYNEEGEKLNLVGGFILPADSGWVKLVIKDQFNVNEFNIVSLNDINGGIKTVGTLYVGRVIAVSNAKKVVEQIDALPAYEKGYSAENKALVAEARAAYNALCMESADKITNIAKLISLEADIWKEGFDVLPATVDELTEYSDEYKVAIDALRASYELLDTEVKKTVKDDEAKLKLYEAKILTFRAQIVNKTVASLTVKDTLYTLDEIKKIKTAATTLSAMNEIGKENLDEGVEAKVAELQAKIAKYHTLSELGGSFADDIINSVDWAPYSANLKDAKEGTIVFKVKGIVAATDGALYVDIFHDPNKNAGQAGDGIAMWVRSNNNTLLFQNGGDKAVGFKDGKTIDKTKTYVFYYTYKVADDYSKLTISIRIDEEGGETVAEGSVDITSVSLSDFGEQTIKQWLTEHENKDAHQTFFINTGNSSGVDIVSAW